MKKSELKAIIKECIAEEMSNKRSNELMFENVFGDMIEIMKVSKKLASAAKRMPKEIAKLDKNDPDMIEKKVTELIQGQIDIIRSSKLSPDMKDSMEDSFKESILDTLKEKFPNIDL